MFVEKMLEAIEKFEGDIVIEISFTKDPQKIKDIVDYLLTKYGMPNFCEHLSIMRHGQPKAFPIQ